ncbi:MAG: InlB B-repeat-containing protein [Oscillospiraceae bacterium]|nr:InlB B-repeat-containing protein [Oscillospiraceae bacterium]
MKKYFKKTMSVFLSFLMVLSCFVFAPEMFTFKADAAKAGSYKITVKVVSSNNTGGWDKGVLKIYGKDKNGKGTETVIVNKSDMYINFNGTRTWIDSVSYDSFPTKLTYEYSFGGGITHRKMDAYIYLYVNDTEVGNVQSYSYEWGTNAGTKTLTVASSKYPKASSISWTAPSAVSLTVPGGTNAATSTATFSTGSTVKDQYGVSWYEPASYVFYDNTSRSGSQLSINGLTASNTNDNSSASDKGTVTVVDTTELKEYVAKNSTSKAKVYAFAKYGTLYSSAYATITIENPKYRWTFNINAGDDLTAKFLPEGVAETYDSYYKKAIGNNFPTDGYRFNYFFDGMYWNNEGGDKITSSSYITDYTTVYAQWKLVNKIAFYNYDGQPYYSVDGKYGNNIGQYVPTTNPTRPGSGSVESYTFERWVNWDTGEELDPDATLNSLNPNSVLKFIAEYTTGTPKTYTYKFYENGSQVNNGSGVYRSNVAFPADPSKADESRDDGYSFKFAGWIVEKDDGTAPADVIVAPGEKLEEKVSGKTFLSADDGSFSYFLKDNIKLYPVYVASYKQCEIILHYKDASGAWQTTTTKNADTTCLKYFNLGIPNPKSYNATKNGVPKTYEFIGWTATEGKTTPDSGMALGSNLAINVQLHNDLEVWATYEEKDIVYKAYYYNNGELVKEETHNYGDTFDVTIGATPEKPREGQTGYSFKGWYLNEEGTGDAYTSYTINDLNNPTFYAVYDSFNYYEVTFCDEDGNVIMIPGADGEEATPATSKDYVAGDVLTPPAVADKEASAKYAYTFTGWEDSKGVFHAKDEVLTVSGDETYTAVFERQIRKYTVKFYDVNGQTFDETDPTVETSTPVRSADLEYGTNIQKYINDNGLVDLVLGSIPETTKQYRYEFSGWSPNINPETTVTEAVIYKATYKTSAVTYNVHWLVPTDANQTGFKDTVTKYLYERIISIPSTKPQCAEPEVWDETNYPREAYNWGFLGWYQCDENGVIKTDADGNELKFQKGTPATEDDAYYVAKFGYASKSFTIKIYNEDKTTVLDEIYGNAYGATVEIPLSYTKNPVADGHYVIDSFKNVADDSVAVTVENGAAEYTVGSTNEIYVSFKKETHTFGPWFTVTEQNYQTAGEDEHFCTKCSYRETRETALLIDDQAPTGIAFIGGYTWPGAATDTTAYVRSDSLVNIVARDLGQADFHNDATAGKGIKTIKYAWVDGETVGDYTEASFDEYDVDANVNFQLPSDFAGKKLTVTIVDYTDREFSFTTAVLNVDVTKPVVETVSNCESIFFGIKEDFELKSVKVEKLNDNGEYEVIPDTEYTSADIGDSDYKAGYSIIAPNGTYRITASDMAGNESLPVVVTAAGAHSFGDYIIDKEATCTETGLKHKKCAICGETTESEEIPMTEHTWNAEATTDVEPTCTEKGSKSIRCSVCGTQQEGSVEEIPALGHDETVKEVLPTCTKGGYKLTTCSRCDLWILETEGYDATGHTADEAQHAHKDATCTEAGYDYDICSVCGEKFNETTIDKLPHQFTKNVTPADACTGADAEGHFYSVWECEVCGATETTYPELAAHDYSVKSDEPVTPASCGKNAVYSYKCSRCDATIEKEERFTALEHNYVFVTDKEATCTEAGSKHEECTICGDKKEAVTIDPLGHDLVVDEEKSSPATCATDGNTYKYCTRCDYFENEVIPATGEHDYTVELTDLYVAPTCETAGSKTFQCNGCDKTNTVEVPALGHKHADDDAGTVIKAATCKEEGVIEYQCLNGEHKYTEAIPVDRNAHDAKDGVLVSTVKAATCTEKGEEIRNCKICGSAVKVEVPALGHDYSGVKVTKEPTCVEDGEKIACCTRCGEIDPAATPEVIKATGSHTMTKHAAVAATCTKDGSKEYYECSVCKKFFADENGNTEIAADRLAETIKISATGHSYGEYIIVAPTCSADGYKYKVCSVCGEKTEREATGEAKLNHEGGVHTLVKINKSATCKDEGEGVYKCSLCGELFIKSIAVDPEAHSATWSTVQATCTEKGSRTKKCDICGKEIETIELPALGHAFKITTRTELQDGKIVTITTHTCTRKGCGYSYDDPAQIVGDACKITFVVNGETSEMTLEKGSKLRKSDLPTIDLTSTDPSKKKEVKWMLGSEEATFPLTVDSDITLVAVITETDVRFTVRFVNTLSRETLSETVYGYDEAVTAPEDPIVSGYTFNGWSTSPSDSSVPVYAGSAIPNATADVTYYTVYTAKPGVKTYYVTFRNHTGTKILSTAIVEDGASVQAPAETPTRTENSVFHYVFTGWVDADGAAVTFPIDNVKANIVVYAKFGEVKHSDCADCLDVKAATCTTPAEATYKCRDCGYTWTQYTAPALGHEYIEVSRTEENGKLTIVYRCSRCGAEWKKTVNYNQNVNAIVVTVKDTDGNPVEGATVQLYIGNLQTMTAVTNEKGQALFPKYDVDSNPDGLKDGEYTVKVTKTGYNDADGTLVIKDGSGSVNLSFEKIVCRCICHSSGFFGKIRRFFNKLIRTLFNKNYTCCSCGECEKIYK